MARSRHHQVVQAGVYLGLPLLAVVLVVLLPLAHFLHIASTQIATSWAQLHSSYLWKIAHFTLWQAGISTLLTAAAALILAVINQRCSFLGKRLLLLLGQVPFFLPSIVVAFAFVMVYGQQGIINTLLQKWGWEEPISFLYNSWAIIAAHVFFNVGFLLRQSLLALAAVPGDQQSWGQLIGISSWQRFRFLEWHYLKRPLLNGCLLIFVLCLNSFAVVLVLGGGPATTTAEVGIYWFLHAEFDLASALVLALFQLLVTSAAAFSYAFPGTGPAAQGLRPLVPRQLAAAAGRLPHSLGGIVMIVLLLAYGCFLSFPLAVLIFDGISAWIHQESFAASFYQELITALGYSLVISGGSAFLASLLGIAAALGLLALSTYSKSGSRGLERCFYLLLGISPVVVSLANALYFRQQLSQPVYAAWLIMVIQALATVPVTLKMLVPGVVVLKANSRQFEALHEISWWAKFRHIELPGLLPIACSAAAAAFALSLGNIAVVAMFHNSAIETLPLLIYRLMGVYRYSEAAIVALVLIVFGLGFVDISARQNLAGKTARDEESLLC